MEPFSLVPENWAEEDWKSPVFPVLGLASVFCLRFLLTSWEPAAGNPLLGTLCVLSMALRPWAACGT